MKWKQARRSIRRKKSSSHAVLDELCTARNFGHSPSKKPKKPMHFPEFSSLVECTSSTLLGEGSPIRQCKIVRHLWQLFNKLYCTQTTSAVCRIPSKMLSWMSTTQPCISMTCALACCSAYYKQYSPCPLAHRSSGILRVLFA